MTSMKTKPIVTRDTQEYVRTVLLRIAEYESRYEMSTDQMRDVVQSGAHRETAEIAKWFQDANIVAHLAGLDEEKNTDGSASTATRRSTRGRLSGTPSSWRTPPHSRG